MDDGRQPHATLLLGAIVAAVAIGLGLLWSQGVIGGGSDEAEHEAPDAATPTVQALPSTRIEDEDLPPPERPAIAERGVVPVHDRPSETDLRDAFDAVRPDLRRCQVDRPLSGEVVITFLGVSGGVQAVELRGALAQHAAARCVERAAYRARVAPFGRSAFVSTHPLTLGVRRQLPLEGEVQTALEQLAPTLARCAQGQGHWVRIAVTIAGATGKPSKVLVLPPIGGTSRGDCMVEPVLEIAVDPFESPSYTAVHRIYF